MSDQTVSVRYMVDDVEESIGFYTSHLGFEVVSDFAPAFAEVVRGNLGCSSAGRRARPGGRCRTGASPGRAAGTASTSSSTTSTPRSSVSARRAFRSATTSSPGPGGKQILVDDPSGNPIELFQPADQGGSP